MPHNGNPATQSALHIVMVHGAPATSVIAVTCATRRRSITGLRRLYDIKQPRGFGSERLLKWRPEARRERTLVSRREPEQCSRPRKVDPDRIGIIGGI